MSAYIDDTKFHHNRNRISHIHIIQSIQLTSYHVHVVIRSRNVLSRFCYLQYIDVLQDNNG